MDKQQKRDLKAAAHKLQPVVIIGGNGYTDGVKAEIELALDSHELIKVRVNAEDRAEREAMIESIIASHKSELIGSIGHIIILYRKRKKK